MKRPKVLVLMGGKSPEYEISLLSGREVMKNIDMAKYNPMSLIISKTGRGIEKIFMIKPDIVFIALHGQYGEDGTIQGFLDSAGIPYTGAGVLASAIGMNKVIFRKIMKSEKIPIPRYVVVNKGNPTADFKDKIGNLPYFVKPTAQGSSVGVSKVNNRYELKKAFVNAFKYGNQVLVDEFVKGLELTCTVIGNVTPETLPIIEIRPLKNTFFDYKSKYSLKGSEEIVPAKISDLAAKKVNQMAIKVYKAVGCIGFARVDFILNEQMQPVVLEINTIPGLTKMSLVPKAAKAAGMSFKDLISKIICYGLQKNC